MEENNPIKNTEDLLRKFDQLKHKEKLDLSSDEDLSIAIMNLVSIEEHFFFTGAKTGKNEYFNLLQEVREIRKSLLQKIVKETEGETWCISKHLLAASMRLMETGTKQQAAGDKKTAEELFKKAYNLYSLFWGINLKLISVADVKKIDDEALNRHDSEPSGFMKKLGDLVKKAIDCCVE
jgi:hypothetical protein